MISLDPVHLRSIIAKIYLFLYWGSMVLMVLCRVSRIHRTTQLFFIQISGFLDSLDSKLNVNHNWSQELKIKMQLIQDTQFLIQSLASIHSNKKTMEVLFYKGRSPLFNTTYLVIKVYNNCIKLITSKLLWF